MTIYSQGQRTEPKLKSVINSNRSSRLKHRRPRRVPAHLSNMNVAYLMQSKSRAFLVLCIGYVSFSNWYYQHNLLASSQKNGNDSNPIDELIDKNQLPSLHILFKFMKNYVPPDEQKLQSPLEVDEESERCQRFGFEYAGRKTRRRIFFGSLISDQ